MYATIPVYYPSLEEAARKDEAALWCDSYNINMSCRNFIWRGFGAMDRLLC